MRSELIELINGEIEFSSKNYKNMEWPKNRRSGLLKD